MALRRAAALLGMLAACDPGGPAPPDARAPTDLALILPCADGVRDGDASDVDCGGTCARCTEGASCLGNLDCATTLCREGRCRAPTCDDRAKGGARPISTAAATARAARPDAPAPSRRTA